MGCLSNKGLKCKWGRFFLVTKMSFIIVSRRQHKPWPAPSFSLIFRPLGLVFRAVPVNDFGPQILACIPSQFKAILKPCGEFEARCILDPAILMPEAKIFLRHDGRAPATGVDKCTMLLKVNLFYSFTFARQYICSFLAELVLHKRYSDLELLRELIKVNNNTFHVTCLMGPRGGNGEEKMSGTTGSQHSSI